MFQFLVIAQSVIAQSVIAQSVVAQSVIAQQDIAQSFIAESLHPSNARGSIVTAYTQSFCHIMWVNKHISKSQLLSVAD